MVTKIMVVHISIYVSVAKDYLVSQVRVRPPFQEDGHGIKVTMKG